MFIALRALTIQLPDGTTERRKPGDAVPEAAGWKNVEAYIQAKHIKRAEVEAKPAPKAKTPKAEAPAEPVAEAVAAGTSPLFGFAKARK